MRKRVLSPYEEVSKLTSLCREKKKKKRIQKRKEKGKKKRKVGLVWVLALIASLLVFFSYLVSGESF